MARASRIRAPSFPSVAMILYVLVRFGPLPSPLHSRGTSDINGYLRKTMATITQVQAIQTVEKSMTNEKETQPNRTQQKPSLWDKRQQIINASPARLQQLPNISVQLPFTDGPISVVQQEKDKEGLHTTWNLNRQRWWKQVAAGTWEPHTFRVLDQEITSDTIYVGFGEWIGPTGLFAMQRASKTIMIDADPLVRGELRENIRRNAAKFGNKVALDFRCINDKAGPVEMQVHGGSGSTVTEQAWSKDFDKVTVDCLPLTDLLQEYSIPIDGSQKLFLKVDTEGGESVILPSLYDWLASIQPASQRPTLYISMHNKADETQKQQIANVLNLYPYFNVHDGDRNNLDGNDCDAGNTGVKLSDNPTGERFTAQGICDWCDYLITTDISRSLQKCHSVQTTN